MKACRLLAISIFMSVILIVPSQLSAGTRGISVVAKSTKGQSQEIQLYDYTAALIIGIDRYENLDASAQLSYAVKDAKGIEKALRDGFQFDEIVTLYNEQATRDKIMQVLYGFRSLTSEGGIFVYFAGHGITIPGTLRGKDLGYLVPYDGTLDSAKMYRNISMQQVRSDICVSITAKHVFFVFDACFAGLMLDTRATQSKPSRDLSYLQAITNEHVRQVLTAGAKGETVLDGGPGGHSVFTGRFIEALRNTEDYITARELGQYLKKLVYGDAAARGHTQRPVDGEIYGTGDFVFVPDLEKKGREISAEVDVLEAEMTRLKSLKEEADQSMKRKIERLQLIKEAELKQAQIRKKQKEDAAKRQRQATLEVNRIEKDRKQREAESEKRLAMLRTQTKRMRQELSKNLTGGATIESAVAEMKKIKEQRDEIYLDFSIEITKQTESLASFYDKKIARIMDIPPQDKEFESKEDFQARFAEAQVKAAPVRKAREEKVDSLRHELEINRDSQIGMLDKQMKELKEKRFILSGSEVSFKFRSYKLGKQIMLGDLTIDGATFNFYVPVPKAKAREYKYHPELLVPEVLFRVDSGEEKFEKVIFHGPEKNETYTGFGGVSEDHRHIAFASGIVNDLKTGLEWVAGPDVDTTWDLAKSWLITLNLEGGGWRMPTIEELEGLYKKGASPRNMTPLLKTTGWWVWSGETKFLFGVGTFNSYTGRSHWEDREHDQTKRAFAVRYGSVGFEGKSQESQSQESQSQRVEVASVPQKPSPSQPSKSTSNIIDRVDQYVAYANGIVKDTKSGLEWKAGPDRDTNWNEARSWVQSLNLDSEGWRMPTTDELKGLYKKETGSRNMTPLLKTTGWGVWSGETKGSSRARDLDFYDGDRSWYGRDTSTTRRAFAVRSPYNL